MSDRSLIQDREPAFYLTRVSFSWAGERYHRFGIIASVRLEPFEKGIVLPHERTFSKVKSERLQLMKCCHANFSPIFSLFSDGKEVLAPVYDVARSVDPQVDLVDTNGHRHRLWAVTDPHLIELLVSFFRARIIYIADGHHRYETALNYRDWVRETNPDFSDDHPANFIMMSLSSMEDAGMIVLPAHRLLKSVSPVEIDSLASRAPDYFDIIPIDLRQGLERALKPFERALESHAHENAIGIYSSERSLLQVMVLKSGVMARHFGDQIPAALRDLDVTVLTQLIMMALMGFDQARLDDATKIGYRTTAADAVAAVGKGDADLAFILNPTRIEQVQRVAEHGLIMPRKSTYFYPKVVSGLIFHLLR